MIEAITLIWATGFLYYTVRLAACDQMRAVVVESIETDGIPVWLICLAAALVVLVTAAFWPVTHLMKF